ncbi:site-specific integrase [Zhongshania sp. BJYM1]|uniref:site-specific integrase n=1 Tax=Zhongshania aquatica TaxID=2965069 RepID=UPI0022B563F3|nr:site-specific integrase [Marortus sp. BJYM1]
MTNPTDRYIHAATRENTRKSYRAAIEHYEAVWGGYLPATADSVAQYLAHYAPTLAINTLKLRLAGLAAWHNDQGFPDPTKSPYVKKVLKGIAELHPHTETQAKPLKLEDLNRVVSWFDEVLRSEPCTRPRRLTVVRNKALFLIGFWRAFRSDELTRINIENVSVVPEKGLEIFLPRSKTDRSAQGRVVRVPALLQLCPVSAYLDWVSEAQLREGPLFPGINRWGHISEKSLHPASVITIIKQSCTLAGIPDADEYSSHSLRRGFASWSNTQQWDIKALMEYVGWKDVKTALKYIEADDPFLSQINKRGLNLPDSNM